LSKILITGGAGFIGSNLAKKLLELKNEVHICDNFSRAKKDEFARKILEHPNASLIEADLSNPDEFSNFEKYDYVYHLAAINGTRHFYEKPDMVLRANLLMCINVLDWFSKTKKGKILFSSSSETYAGTISSFGGKIPTPETIELCINDVYNPRWSYGGSKIAGELLFINYARVHKFPMTIVRYHNIYGPRMGFEHVIPNFVERAYKKENPFKVFGLKNTRAFCYISDAVEATRLALESKNTDMQIINIGNSFEEISIGELAKKIVALAKYNPKIIEVKSPEGSVERRCPDTEKMRNLIGFTPKIKLDEGLEKTFRWYYDYYDNCKGETK
jgi:nucleoside-diphosphate-sugar epimerase